MTRRLEWYFMRGYYELDGENHPQVGIFQFNLIDKTLEGTVFNPEPFPSLVNCPSLINIKGRIEEVDDNIKIRFVTETDSKIGYVLEKEDSRRGISGKHRGFWTWTWQYRGRGLATMILDKID